MHDEINRLLARVDALENSVLPSDLAAKLDIVNRLTQNTTVNNVCDCGDKVAVLQAKIDNLEKQVKSNAIIADSARRTFGEEIGVLKSHIDKEFSKLKGGNNG